MSVLDRISPEQKKILAIGAPVVAVFAFVNVVRKGDVGASTATGAATSGVVTMPNTGAIGVGQLADFESLITQSITQLAQSVNKNQEAIAAIPAPVNTTTTVIAAPVTKTLKNLSSSWFPEIAPQGTDMAIIGSAGGGTYNAGNLANGAPLYALIGGQFRQNFGRPEDLPAGTTLATLGSLDDYVVMG